MLTTRTLAALIGAPLLLVTSTASAFCGFYVASGNSGLVNDASHVVLMRHGTTTVLSMQNDYQGPPEDFAMVVPVPTVLSEENVKTLPQEVFAHVLTLTGPRLVEYWEQDPCEPSYGVARGSLRFRGAGGGSGGGAPTGIVTIEAQFEVGEYDVVILAADESNALDGWLRENGYHIPEGAAEALRPYVESGMKFFVAKVNVSRVTFEGGRAALSPLRVSYESEDFSLPVRLGMLNSNGSQDLIVHVLSLEGRFEVANYPNVFIPTNLDMQDAARENFGAVYDAIFENTLAEHPGAVVTEYSWSAAGCDPCPADMAGLSATDAATLGADIIPAARPSGPNSFGRGRFPSNAGAPPANSQLTLTRLHFRYPRGTLGEDLVFRQVDPVLGGREFDESQGASPSGVNNFQGRYVIRHAWEGEIACESPIRDRWVGPPGDDSEKPATSSVGRSRGGGGAVDLASLVPALALASGSTPAAETEAPGVVGETPVGEIPVGETPVGETPVETPSTAPASADGCGCASSGSGAGALWPALAMLLIWRRRHA